MKVPKTLREIIQDSIQVKQQLLTDEHCMATLEETVAILVQCFEAGGKVLWCGNGGSAADAQHLAAEFSGRFYLDRRPLFSEALHVNSSYMTAVANDYDFTEVYARLIQAKGQAGDVLIGLSTSGNSPNIVKALAQAQEQGLTTIAWTGATKGNVLPFAELSCLVPSTDTPRIQEAHLLMGHAVCELVERALFGK
ncbi:MAG: D-sedoheptulose-7-phosphate isomerase [Aureispira sp.]